MSETTQNERDEWRRRGGPGTWNGEHGRRLLNDADRFAQAEKLLREASSACEPIASRLSERIDSFLSEQGLAAPQRGGGN